MWKKGLDKYSTNEGGVPLLGQNAHYIALLPEV